MKNVFKTLDLRKRAKRFASDSRGNVAMMAGLTAIPLIIAGGSAIDYERAINAKTELQASLDAAVLSAASSNSDNMETLTTDSRKYLEANYHGTRDATIKSYAITAGDVAGTLKATGVVSLNTWFMATVGIYSMDVKASSQAVQTGSGRNVNLEVSLVLDNTNSMNTGDGSTSNSPITDLKAAAKNFVNTVMSSNQVPYSTKIAIIPYNNSVNMGSGANAQSVRGTYITSPNVNSAVNTPGYQYQYFNTAAGGSNTFQITNCVSERTGAQAYTDAAASSYPVGRVYATSSNGCTVTPVMGLSTSASDLNAKIDAMSASNSTAGQVGIAWGWYALSPNFGYFTGPSAPAGYDKLNTTVAVQKVKKIMILMTDGEYNSVYSRGIISGNPQVSGSGGAGDHINTAPDNGDVYTQSNNMCTAMKQSGIEVYTIAFQLNSSYPQRVALLKNCASDSSHALNASNQSQLNSVFQSLALSLVTMRLTN